MVRIATSAHLLLGISLLGGAVGHAAEPETAPQDQLEVVTYEPAVAEAQPRGSDDADLDQLGRIGVFVGAKFLDEDEWDPIETHAEFGLLTTFGVEEWPVSISVNGFISGMSNDGARGTTVELQVGVTKIWQPDGPFEYSLGAGPELAASAYRTGGDTDTDLGLGFWVTAAGYWRLPQRFLLGPMVSYSHATLDIGDDDIDAGGLHVGLVAAYGW